ncbi:MAG: CDP-diacylglycerol--glycerol-3-phosphate 3-phosphatidyltransferase [Clostridia bacterium]|nr:CDP-diacylglycerol--glycerol-3-phosphate 3-phosphatidyltransferase [Clostridia bacterium]MBR5772691.1 CDP-diacylglycerol--glycerol-3-phosphate 3-phosphatidyltransferase [Clostridia bacterium]
MNLPNKLTVIRIVLVPFFLGAMVIKFPYHFLVAAVIFLVASATDFLDGRIARKTNQVTVFGKLCDPLADKMLTTAALLAFMELNICNIWIPMIILAREFLVTSMRLVASSQGIVIAASLPGKIKTVTQMVFSTAIIAALAFHTEPASGNEKFVICCNILLGITALFAVISGALYIKEGSKKIDITK